MCKWIERAALCVAPGMLLGLVLTGTPVLAGTADRPAPSAPASAAKTGNAAAITPVAAARAALGRSATAAEIAAWDIDVRPDWQGLPPGSGTVAQGQTIWDTQCASCHGTFGESNQVFTPIIGGTTQADIASGHVAALANNSQPQRTTMMKLATLSTLWDYIRRAMPWNAPKSLSPDQVYALTAYILNLAEVVPDDFELNQSNIAQVQQRLPNRYGLSKQHGMWQTDGKADVQNLACLQNCGAPAQIRSSLPPAARNAHGNLALQNRSFGAVRGIDTDPQANPAHKATLDTMASTAKSAKSATNANASDSEKTAAALAREYGCTACHHPQQTLLGPGFTAIAGKYPLTPDNLRKLDEKLQQGGSGVWGSAVMPPQNQVPPLERQRLLNWILSGAAEGK